MSDTDNETSIEDHTEDTGGDDGSRSMDGDPVVVGDDGSIVYRASSIGACLTSLVAGRLGYTATRPHEKTQKAYDRGHNAEDVVKGRMREEGWVIWDEQQEVRVQITGKISVVGHIDGKMGQRVTVNHDEGSISTIQQFLGEVKSQADREWSLFEQYGWESSFFPKYRWQVSSYMIATGLPLAMIRAHVNKLGEIVGIEVEYVEQPFYSVEQIRLRLLTVEMMAARMDIPECEKPIFGCPYWYLPEHNADADKDRIVLDDDEFEKLCIEFEQARLAAKLYEAKAKVLRPTVHKLIVDRTGDIKTALVTSGAGVKVTRWEQKNPSYVDYDAMVNDGVIGAELIEQYRRQTKGWRVKVTLPASIKGIGNESGSEG